ncbi:MAG: hypothetical protein M1834_006152 [Cirrosporium novae-zelandiae]|nr:MAG: hypothetical protein M1834_006152 [Cirrosporium novae-zelandiae]
MASPAPSHQEVLRTLIKSHEALLRAGEIQPWVLPGSGLGVILLVLYLIIPHGNSKLFRYAKYPAFAICTYLLFVTIRDTRAIGLAHGYGIGLIYSWFIIWGAVLVLVEDPQRDYKRIEFREAYQNEQDKEINGILSSGASTISDDGSSSSSELEIRRRNSVKEAQGNGHIHFSNGTAEMTPEHSRSPSPQKGGHFVWQPFPKDSFAHRFEWVLDVFFNFQGTGWNWLISSLPPPPPSVQHELEEPYTPPPEPPRHRRKSRTGNIAHPTTRALISSSIVTSVVCYLACDIIFNYIVPADAYFYTGDPLAKATWLPESINSNPILLRCYRLLMLDIIIYFFLTLVFNQPPLFFAGLLPLISSSARKATRSEPWMHPTAFGSFSMILDRGLAGYWGGWWHQSFRFSISAPSIHIIRKLGWSRRSVAAQSLQSIIAFSLTGFIHACATYTDISPTTQPLNPFLFFIFQAFGMIFQQTIIRTTRTFAPSIYNKPTRSMKRFLNLIYTAGWLYLTAPFLADDFGKAALWLFSPLPVSVVRWRKGEGFWCWGGKWVYWYTGQHWWQSGLAFW